VAGQKAGSAIALPKQINATRKECDELAKEAKGLTR
jgi:hypothetical protein